LREFTTAARQTAPSAIEGAEPITFKVDGEEFTAYPPTAGQLALVTAAQSEYTPAVERVKALIDFLDGLLDEHGRERFRERLLDRDDPFDFDTVEGVIEWAMEEWSARPTQSPSGSTPSQRRTGPRSTATRHSAAAAAS
jgi:hypothetical protein